jgi:Rod binding domain-containing protein
MQPAAFSPSDMAARIADASAPARPTAGGSKAKAWATAQDFEAVFLNAMMQHMFTGMEGEGPLGGKGAAGVWRSFLTQEYAKTFVKSGGVGLADHVYRSLIAQQEARAP